MKVIMSVDSMFTVELTEELEAEFSKPDFDINKLSPKLLGGAILIVKNLMWVNPADLFNEKYSVVVHFEGRAEPQTYTPDGLHEWDNPYNFHNIVSIDGKAVI